MSTATLPRSRSSKTRNGGTPTTATRKPAKIIVELPYGAYDAAATQEPLHVVISQLESFRPAVSQLNFPAHAKAEAAAINRDTDTVGMRAWGCKIVGLIVEVPGDLANTASLDD